MALPLPEYYTKLLDFRTKENVILKPCKHLKESIKLRNYQAIGVLHLITAKRLVIGDGTGLGKTLQCLAAYAYVKEKNPDLKLLVVASKSSLFQWGSEVEKFMQDVTVKVVSNGYYRVRKGLALTGKASREYQLNEFFEKNYDILVVNYNTIDKEHETLIPKLGDYMVIFDEATYFKNYKVKIFRTACRVSSSAKRVVGLSATVIKNRLEEAYAIFNVVQPGLFTNISRFRNAFHRTIFIPIGTYKDKETGEDKVRYMPKLAGYKNLGAFRKYIDPYFLGRKKEDVAKELPILVSKEVFLEMEEDQQKTYFEALDGVLTLDTGEVKELEKVSTLMYCQQISNSPPTIGVTASSSKEEELIRALKDDFSDEKVIIYTNFKKQIDRFEEMFKKEGIKMTRITGDENSKKREENKNKFQDPCSGINVIFINRAGSESINLQIASTFIFFDMPWSYGDYLQLVGRAQRIGSEHQSILVLHYINKGSIDEHVLKILKSKKNLVTEVFGETKTGELHFDNETVHLLFDNILEDANEQRTEKKAVKSRRVQKAL